MYSSYLSAATEIAREAGALVARYFERRVAVEYKGDFDVVTEADRASEALIVERLAAKFPGHSVVAEEGTGVERASEFTWYVDPLDGTTNFAHGFPMFAVTLALEQQSEMVAGVVYDPASGLVLLVTRTGNPWNAAAGGKAAIWGFDAAKCEWSRLDEQAWPGPVCGNAWTGWGTIMQEVALDAKAGLLLLLQVRREGNNAWQETFALKLDVCRRWVKGNFPPARPKGTWPVKPSAAPTGSASPSPGS